MPSNPKTKPKPKPKPAAVVDKKARAAILAMADLVRETRGQLPSGAQDEANRFLASADAMAPKKKKKG